MSGHSKWASIKHKKGALDAKRGKIFTRIIREITTAAKIGGGDPAGNPRLRLAIDNAKANNMPAKNIENAIAKGTGSLEGVNYEEITYECYGPGGVAIMMDVMTDNKNRTVSELRFILVKNNGNLAENGAVGWMFKKMGVITVDKTKVAEETLMELALDAGASDMETTGEAFEITVPPEHFEKVRQALEKKGIPMMSAEISRIPQNTVKLEGSAAEKVLKLMDLLEDHDDVQHVYANFDIDEKELERLAK